jgi:hypothetical protein
MGSAQRQDPIALLIQQESTRLPSPRRGGGAGVLMAADLASAPIPA